MFPNQALTEFHAILEVRLHCKSEALFLVCYQSHVFVIANVLRYLAKNAAANELEEILFKLFACLFSQFCTKITISLESCTLLKLDYLLYYLEHQPMFQCLIESSNVHHILFLVA